jgi:hypothetical protein
VTSDVRLGIVSANIGIVKVNIMSSEKADVGHTSTSDIVSGFYTKTDEFLSSSLLHTSTDRFLIHV